MVASKPALTLGGLDHAPQSLAGLSSAIAPHHPQARRTSSTPARLEEAHVAHAQAVRQ